MSQAESDDLLETSGSGSNILATIQRRWPWLLLGAVLGAIGGFLLFSTKAPIYQSTAQVLVIKKRADVSTGSDSRSNFVEDYVATQVTLLRSERILIAAAKRIDPTRLNHAFPTDERDRAKVLAALLSVARDKDVTTSAAGGTNVLNLAFRGSHPDDCRQLLSAVIATYQAELSTLYDTATQDKIDLLALQLKQFKTELDTAETGRVESEAKLRKITPEDLTLVRGRVSKETEALRGLQLEEIGLRNQVELIRNTPADRAARVETLAKLGEQVRSLGLSRQDLDNTENAVRKLQLDRAEYFKKYNVDHPLIQSIDAQIAFLNELNQKANPRPAGMELDQLAIVERVLDGRWKVVQQQLKFTTASLDDDKSILSQATNPSIDSEYWKQQVVDRKRRIDEALTQKNQIEVTRGAGGFQASIINEPTLDATPVAPRLSQSLMLGIAAGLLFGFLLAAFAELSDQSFRSPADIRKRLGMSLIGHIPPIRMNVPAEVELALEPTLVAALRPKSSEAEAYRGVRTAIFFNLNGSGHQMIQVTSPNQGDGKSTLAANLAISIAQSGRRVILVDCDLRRPRIERLFQLTDNGVGLVSVILGECEPAAAGRPSGIENLTILTSGPKPSNPAELLTSPRFQVAIEKLRADYDFVILDTPPLLAVSDASVVASRADGVILVFRMSSKARPTAERARDMLAQLGAKVIGVVVNGSGRAKEGYGGYGGYTAEYHQYDEKYSD